MRKRAFLPLAALLGLVVLLPGQDAGPNKGVGETVARPRKKGEPAEAEQPKIPSKLSRKDKPEFSEQPDFKVDTSVVNVDVAVLDNKGRFIPNIPQENLRTLEDNAPQQISILARGEAPVPLCMVLEL